jgi:hypothetical protein
MVAERRSDAIATSRLGAQQLDGADPASSGESSVSYYRSAGRAAHLGAVRRHDSNAR